MEEKTVVIFGAESNKAIQPICVCGIDARIAETFYPGRISSPKKDAIIHYLRHRRPVKSVKSAEK